MPLKNVVLQNRGFLLQEGDFLNFLGASGARKFPSGQLQLIKGEENLAEVVVELRTVRILEQLGFETVDGGLGGGNV